MMIICQKCLGQRICISSKPYILTLTSFVVGFDYNNDGLLQHSKDKEGTICVFSRSCFITAINIGAQIRGTQTRSTAYRCRFWLQATPAYWIIFYEAIHCQRFLFNVT